jgi:hypothetical protein
MKTSFALLFASVSTASAQLVDVYKNSRRTLLEQEAMSAKTQISLGMMLPRLRLKSIYLCLCRVAHKRLEVMHPGKVLTASAKCGENVCVTVLPLRSLIHTYHGVPLLQRYPLPDS